jgi:TetR/AcrR family acrAB operon transcriptional repressor
MARRTKEDALITRDLILDAAERVFLRRGVARTALQEIAEEAQLTRGAIYWHFQNKADVFDAMLQRVTLPMVARFNNQPQAESDNPLEHLRQNVVQAFHQTVHDLQVRRVFEIASHRVEYGDDLQAVRERHIAERSERVVDLARVLALAQAKGQLPPQVSARCAAVGLHALLDGLMANWLLQPEAFDLEAVGAGALDAYLAGLACCSGGQ